MTTNDLPLLLGELHDLRTEMFDVQNRISHMKDQVRGMRDQLRYLQTNLDDVYSDTSMMIRYVTAMEDRVKSLIPDPLKKEAP